MCIEASVGLMADTQWRAVRGKQVPDDVDRLLATDLWGESTPCLIMVKSLT